MQPRFVLQQALPRQPVVLSHVRPAQPWLGQLQQLPVQVKPAAGHMAPAAMPTPTLKDMAKPAARPLRWVYAAPMQPKVVLPCQKVVSAKVMAPEQKKFPKEVAVEGMPKIFWGSKPLPALSRVKMLICSSWFCYVLPSVPKATGGVRASETTTTQRAPFS